MASNRKIILSPSHMSGYELQYVQLAISTNWVSSEGINIDEFENSLETYLGEQKQVVALSSGTAAIHFALLLAGVQQGDEVIVPVYTYCAKALACLNMGAKPVMVDV
jgi:dTDP-4-amino-4,6-dideoxygalactose transaminase